jgi:uncharacterized membrane protein
MPRSRKVPSTGPESSSPATGRRVKERIASVDLVRGLVMVIMALDHTRDFFHNSRFDPTALSHVSAALFLTRLVTHLCAPTFVFLAGTSAFLSSAAGRSRAALSKHLLIRGLWLVLLELTVVHFGWSLWNPQFFTLQVIWALGWCMIALAGLVWLPLPAIGAIGGAMVLLHNLLDLWQPENAPLPAWLWSVLHAQQMLELGPHLHLFVFYPLVPWIGVMALGYVFGAALPSAPETRRKRALLLGIICLAAFAALRASNLYGDPQPWAAPVGRPGYFAALAFFNTAKYPPSLLYLLMTLGTMFLLLGAAEVWRPSAAWVERLRGALLTFGRVPLFFYVLHLPLLQVVAMLDRVTRYGWGRPPEGFGHDLPVVYGVWAGVVVVMYFLCRWYDAYKRQHPRGWTRWI